jgi:hypothetical protein
MERAEVLGQSMPWPSIEPDIGRNRRVTALLTYPVLSMNMDGKE